MYRCIVQILDCSNIGNLEQSTSDPGNRKTKVPKNSITKQVAKLNLSFCCLQELKYRNTGKQLITVDSGEKYEFHWCGMRKRREAGVGMLINIDKEITYNWR